MSERGEKEEERTPSRDGETSKPKRKRFFQNQLKGTKVQNHEGLEGEMEGEGR